MKKGNVQFSELSHLRLGLEAEKGVVQLLVVDVDLAHLRLNAFASLLLERLSVLLLLDGVALSSDTSIGNEACGKDESA